MRAKPAQASLFFSISGILFPVAGFVMPVGGMIAEMFSE